MKKQGLNMGKETPSINEVVDINGSKVYVENGQVKVTLNEEIQRTGYMSVEEMRQLGHIQIDKMYNLYCGTSRYPESNK